MIFFSFWTASSRFFCLAHSASFTSSKFVLTPALHWQPTSGSSLHCWYLVLCFKTSQVRTHLKGRNTLDIIIKHLWSCSPVMYPRNLNLMCHCFLLWILQHSPCPFPGNVKKRMRIHERWFEKLLTSFLFFCQKAYKHDGANHRDLETRRQMQGFQIWEISDLTTSTIWCL